MPRRKQKCVNCDSDFGLLCCGGGTGKSRAWGSEALQGIADLEPIKAAVVASTLDGIVVVGEDGCVLALNPAAEAMFGWPADEARGRPIGELIVPEHLRAAHRDGFAAYIAGGPPKVLGKRVEVQALHRDGRLIPVELTVLEIKVEGRRVFTATIRDRSANAAQQEELAQTRRQLELAVEGAQLGTWSYDPRTGMSWYSDRVKEIVGMEENFLPDGEAFRQRVHPDDRDQLVFDRQDHFPEGPVAREYRVVRPDGEIRWLHSLGAAARGESGEVEAVHGVIIDITDRKRAEENLEIMRRRLELAVEGAELGVWTLDLRDGSWWFSDRARDLIGLADNHYPSQRGFRERVHPDDWERLMALYQTGFPEGSIGVEYRVVHPDGSVRWLYGLGASDSDEAGKVEAIHGIVADITNRKTAEEELEQTRRQLELAINGAQLGIWSYDPHAPSLWFSDRSRDLLGLADNYLADARDLEKVVHPDDWETLAAPYYGRYPDEPLAMEFRVVRPDGSIRWIGALGAAVRDEKGRFEAVHGIHFDVTERKRAEEELELARRQLELAVDGARLGLWSVDPKTGAVWHSDVSYELWGMAPDEPIDVARLKSLIHPDDWAMVRQPYREGFPSDTVSLEHRLFWPNGEVRWLHALGRAQRDSAGEVVMVSGIHLDITERKRSEEALALARNRLDLAVEGACLGAWSYDFTTGRSWYSDRSKEMYGLPADREVTTEGIRDALHPDDWAEVSRPYFEGFEQDRVEVEYRVFRPDGTMRWIYSLGAAERDESGTVHTVNGIHLDITERKAAEEELAETRRQLELAVAGANIGSWTVDPETGATWYSARSREIHGLDPDTPLTVKGLKSSIHPDDWQHVLESYRQNFPGDNLVLEHRVVRPDGEVRWVQSLGTARRDSSGKVRLVSGIHIDVTERRTAEAELARSREALMQSEKLAALGSLLAGVSHELNNPLAAIVGQADMLTEDAAGTPLEQRAQRIGAAAERCARIVQTFLAMARQRERQVISVSMNDVISSALELTEYGLRTAGIAVRVNFGSALPPVQGDRDQLHQVLVNLIVNSQQAMEKGETFEKVLTIRTSVNQAGRVLVDVMDSGPGVPEAVRHRIFDPFFTTKKQQGSGGGTGIGLSFSQGIVAAHGGTLTIESSRRGAHFRIELPAAAAEPIMVVPAEATIIAEPVSARRRCLVVEDEADVADTLRELIEREGYEVSVAPNGIEALHALEREEFDMVVSDLRMPQLNGPELHARLSETHPELVARMAFVTGDTIGDAMGEFARNCGRPVLEKPFTRAGVRALLAALAEPEARA